jgi:hypothetical protein
VDLQATPEFCSASLPSFLGNFSDPLVGSAADRCACVTIVLAVGHGVAMMALFGLLQSCLLSRKSRR